MEGLFRSLGIYAHRGQLYDPVDSDQVLVYREDRAGQILEEGITEAGAMSSWIAAATSFGIHNLPMIPFFIFYSMFGFQRVGDLAWGGRRQSCTRISHRRYFRSNHPGRRRPAAPGRAQPRARLHHSQLPGLRPGLCLRACSDYPPRDAGHVCRSKRLVLLHHGDQRELRAPCDAEGLRGGHHPGDVPPAHRHRAPMHRCACSAAVPSFAR